MDNNKKKFSKSEILKDYSGENKNKVHNQARKKIRKKTNKILQNESENCV